LENEVRVSNDFEVIDNIQFNLFEGTEIEKIYTSKIVGEGMCVTCQTNHIECPACKSLLTDVNDNDDQYSCNDCDQGYKIGISLKNKDKIIYQINENEFIYKLKTNERTTTIGYTPTQRHK